MECVVYYSRTGSQEPLQRGQVKEFRDKPGHRWEAFKAAIDYCKQHGCLLVVSHIGKRAADLPMLEVLAESGIEFETPGLTPAGLPKRLEAERKRRDRLASRVSARQGTA